MAGGDTAYDGPFWDALRPEIVVPSIAANGVTVFLVGGWHDAFQRGTPLNYSALHNAFTGGPTVRRWNPANRYPTGCGC